PLRTPHRDLGPAQCGDGSTTRPSGSETRTHSRLRPEIWAPHTVPTGLRPVRPGHRPGPTPGPTQRFGPRTMWRRVYDPSVRVRDPDPLRTHTEILAPHSVATGLRPVRPGQRPGPTPDSAQRFGPRTVWRRVYDPSVRVRDPDPHRTPH